VVSGCTEQERRNSSENKQDSLFPTKSGGVINMKRISVFARPFKVIHLVVIFSFLYPAVCLGQEQFLDDLNIAVQLVNPKDNSSVPLSGREIKLTSQKVTWQEGYSVQKLLTANHFYADGDSLGILYKLNSGLDFNSLKTGDKINLPAVKNKEEFSREFDNGYLVLLTLDNDLKQELLRASKEMSVLRAQASRLDATQFGSPGERDNFVKATKSLADTMEVFNIVRQGRTRPLSSDMLKQMINEVDQAKPIIQNAIDGQKPSRSDAQTLDLIEKNMARRKRILAEEKGEKPFPLLVKTNEGPSWNVWLEESPVRTPTPDFRPVPYVVSVSDLSKGSYYQLFLDLAAISYGKNERGAYTLPAGPAFNELLDGWLEKFKDHKDKKIELTTLLIVDPAHFECEKTVSTMTVSLNKIQKLRKIGQIKIERDPFEIMAREADPDFVYGRVGFRIKVKPGQPEGRASVSLSIWVNNRPVEEISVRFCIAKDSSMSPACQGISRSQFGLRGVDSLRVALEDAPFPDAALNFLELEEEKVFGVFRRSDSPHGEYVTWPLGIGIDGPMGLRTLLDTQVAAFVMARDREDQMRSQGEGLYNILFPDTQTEARSAFEKFFKEYLPQNSQQNSKEQATQIKATAAKRSSPSIFIRLLQQTADPPPLIPLGLMAVSLDGKTAEFLGFHFRIENPLHIQSYQPSTECLSRLVTVIPTAQVNDPDLKKSIAQLVNCDWSTQAAKSFTMKEFSPWISEMAEEKDPAAIIIMSHHTKNTIFFEKGSGIVASSSQLKRTFRKPSIAILNGCGTGSPGGAFDFVRKFNLKRVDTIIATSSEVDATMAGDFLDSLGKVLQGNQDDKKFTISEAYSLTLQALRQKYGPRVLEYNLLGNGNVSLCLPKKTEKTQ
jgi:hypothetical protein